MPDQTIADTSLTRAESARRNGARSRGPATETGKAVSSQNRVRHGLLARTIVLKGESYRRFSTLLNRLRGEFLPEGPVETALVDTIAACCWRRMRLWSLERAAINHEVQNSALVAHPLTQFDPPTQVALAWRNLSDAGRSLDLLSRYEGRLDSQYDRALRRLAQLQKNEQLQKRRNRTNPGSI
jgi:hypothetical protein